MVRHDLACESCNRLELDCAVDTGKALGHCRCGGILAIVYLPRVSRTAACHPSETCVVYYSPAEGNVQYPARNDIPVPARLQARGYIRQEMRSIHDIQRFEKQHHVINERIWYDRGSGRGPEDAGR